MQQELLSQCLWALGNFALDQLKTVSVIGDSGVLDQLAECLLHSPFNLQQEIITLVSNVCSQKERPPFSSLMRIVEATAQLLSTIKIPQSLQEPQHVECITKMFMILLKGMTTHSVTIMSLINNFGLVQKSIHILKESSHHGHHY